MPTKPKPPFPDWWDRLVDLATDLHMEHLLHTSDDHRADWRAGLTPGEVLEMQAGAYRKLVSGEPG